MSTNVSRITKTRGVCGGEACLAGARYPVWGFLESRRQGLTDEGILQSHPQLTQADLNAAWDYYANNPSEIERALWENEACMVRHDETNLLVEMIRRGRRLDFSPDEIHDAFEPPLSRQALQAGLSDMAQPTVIGA